MQPTVSNDPSFGPVIAQLSALSPDQRIEVQDFIEFLLAKKAHQEEVRAAMSASTPVLVRYWDNEDDAEYDKL